MKSRSKLQRRLQIWGPSAAVFAVGSALSWGLWTVLDARLATTAQERLDQQSLLFTTSLEQRLQSYGDLLQGMKPALDADSAISLEVFASSHMTQDSALRHQSVEALSVARRMSSSDAPMPLQYVIDEAWPRSAKAGLLGRNTQDLSALRQQILDVQGIRAPLMSAPLTLHASPLAVHGVLISVALRVQRQEVPERVLTLGVRLDRLIEQLHGRGILPDAIVNISDVTEPGMRAASTVYTSAGWDATPADPISTIREVAILGRDWEMEFRPQGSMLSSVERSFPSVVAGSTLGVTLLLAAVVVLLSLQRVRAQIQAAAKDNLLRARTDKLKALFHQSAIGVAEIDPRAGRYISTNTRFAEVVGFSTEALESMDIYAVIHPEDQTRCKALQMQLSEGKITHFTLTQRMVRADGDTIWTEVWVSALLNADGQPGSRQIALVRDATEQRQMQEQLKERENYSSEMLRYMPVGLVVVGPLGNIEFVNHQFELVTGWTQTDISDESTMWRHLCGDKQQHALLLQRLNAGRCDIVPSGVNMPAMEYALLSKCGRKLDMEVSGRFLGGRILLSFVDITERKAAEAEIQWLGEYDSLTKLPNRRLLLDRLSETLLRYQRTSSNKGALLLLDIDNFKSLNETVGHAHGDALLSLVGTRLSNCIAGQHILARQGGDEFAVVLEELPLDPLEAGRCTEQIGRTILEALRTPFYLGSQDFHVTVSMGAVVFGEHGDTVEDLLKHADLALYQAKSAGRDTLQFFDPSMQKAVSARVELEKDMRLALERHEFDLFFQPQVQHDKVIGAEALLRWKHPFKGLVPPGVFVPAAEESGLILPMGEWVLYAACRQLAHWAQDPVMAHLTMSVNVSPRQFYQPNFVEQVQQALLVTGANPNQLELELTEGMLLTDVDDTIQKMVQLKKIGVIFSLDDFGTGYSSLSYLKRLPLDKLKIDQSFVREVVTSANDATIACSIIALGTSLGLQVIAEGVETEAQRAFLADNGCSYWQGFYFSRPQPAPEFAVWTQAYAQQMQVTASGV